jgi:hypothetical protein
MRKLVPVLLICLTFASSAARAQAGPYAPRVFVFTAEPKGPSPTDEEQGRLDSVRDVREALEKKAGIVLVPTAAEAQVLVEVMRREEREAPLGGFGGAVLTRPIDAILRLHIKIGEHETDVKGSAKGYWSRAAKDAVDKAVSWIARTVERQVDAKPD